MDGRFLVAELVQGAHEVLLSLAVALVIQHLQVRGNQRGAVGVRQLGLQDSYSITRIGGMGGAHQGVSAGAGFVARDDAQAVEAVQVRGSALRCRRIVAEPVQHDRPGMARLQAIPVVGILAIPLGLGQG
jgi:hypothetical protein